METRAANVLKEGGLLDKVGRRLEQVGLLAAANRERNNMQEQRHSGKTKANPQNQMAELSRAGHRDEGRRNC